MSWVELLPYLAVLSGPLTLLGLGLSAIAALRSRIGRAARSRRGADVSRTARGRLTWAWLAAAGVVGVLVAAGWGSGADTAPTTGGRAPCERTVALTFDDGPDPAVTPKILQHLDRRGVKAT